LHSERFVDTSPTEVWATLLDEGRYLGSISTFYRLLRQAGESRERRRQATHPATVKPELVALEPNQVWSWDIQAARPGEVELVLPVRDLGHLLPLRSRMDGC
jgi:putative transposase